MKPLLSKFVRLAGASLLMTFNQASAAAAFQGAPTKAGVTGWHFIEKDNACLAVFEGGDQGEITFLPNNAPGSLPGGNWENFGMIVTFPNLDSNAIDVFMHLYGPMPIRTAHTFYPWGHDKNGQVMITKASIDEMQFLMISDTVDFETQTVPMKKLVSLRVAGGRDVLEKVLACIKAHQTSAK